MKQVFRNKNLIIKNLLKKKEEFKKITNERQLILKDFLEKINPFRINAKYKPLTPQALGVKLSHINTEDLKIFFRMCKRANNFSKYFWWKLK